MLTIRPLTERDLEAALRLSTQAGWNQLAADWRRLIALWPDGCLAGCVDGRVVATGTLATFGRSIGWLGMVLVDESQRGRGHGGAVFDALLQLADSRGISRLGLDATDLGRPVYLKRGFVDVVGVDRWVCPSPSVVEPQKADTDLLDHLDEAQWRDVVALDREAVGVDRSALLRHLAGEPGACVRVALRGGRVTALGIRRSGRTADAIAPVIAGDRAAGEAVIASLLRDASPERATIIDVPRDSGIEATLAGLGFSIARRLTRMLRPSPRGGGEGATLHSPQTLGGCGFELG